MIPFLHGIENPNIRRENASEAALSNRRERALRCDCDQPPFGGEVASAFRLNFRRHLAPARLRFLFMQSVMRSLKRGGRCGRWCARRLPFGAMAWPRGESPASLREFNLHTIVRLPNGVFAPYTSIPTNLLFFDRTGRPGTSGSRTLPGRQDTKTRSLRLEEFQFLLAWWDRRGERTRLKVRRRRSTVLTGTAEVSGQLDRKNPNQDDLEHLPPGWYWRRASL